MLRRLIARLTGKPHRPNLPPLDPPIKITCANAWARLPMDTVMRIRQQREDQQRAIEIYALIGYDADGRPLPQGSRPLPDPAKRWLTGRTPIRRD